MNTILLLIDSHIENKRDCWSVSASGWVLLSRAPLSVHYRAACRAGHTRHRPSAAWGQALGELEELEPMQANG